MAKRVVIHVGLPKCGSSSVQLRLAGAREPLARAGIAYPLTDPATGRPVLNPADPDTHLPQHMRLADALTRPTGAGMLGDLLRDFDRSDAGTLVLSSESFVRRVHRFADDALAALRGYEVELVLFVRRRDRWLLAMYKQAVRAWKRRWRGSFDRWLDDPPEYEHNTVALRLADSAERLAALTGGRLRVFDLDAGGDRGGDTRVLMGEVLGVRLSEWPDAERVRRPGTLLDAQRRLGLPFNASLSDAATLFLAMIDGDALDQGDLRELNAAIAGHGFEDREPAIAILSPERSAELVAGGVADRVRLGLAPVPPSVEASGRTVRLTLTLAEWQAMAKALCPGLTEELAAKLLKARVTELD